MRDSVTHRRHATEATGNVAHRFRYPVTMPYLFLDELDEVTDLHPMWSTRRPNAVWFRRADYLGDPTLALDAAVRDAAEQRLGRRPSGPIAMLGHLRTWGWLSNPVTFYFCFNPNDMEVDAVVAEVTSTPWHERHVYALARRRRGAPLREGHARLTFLGHGRRLRDLLVDARGAHLGPSRQSPRVRPAPRRLNSSAPSRADAT